MVTFTSPVKSLVVEDWPLGRDVRGKCEFKVESHPKRGVRVSRVTTGKPKYTTYAKAAAIVEGSNGRTYLLMMADAVYGSPISIMSSDMQHVAPNEEVGKIYVPKDDERYPELAKLIESAS